MSVRGRLAAGATLLALGLAAATSGVPGASAATLDPTTGEAGSQLIVLGDGGNATALVPLAVEHLFPSSSVSRTFRLRLAGPLHSGRPAVVIDGVRDHERGCNHPETASGDTSCGSGDDQGELSTQLLAGVNWAPAAADGCEGTTRAPVASMHDLAGVTLSTDDAVSAAGPDTCVTLTLSLPASADNLVQTDGATFDLRIGLVDSLHDGDAAFLGGGSSSAATSASGPAAGGSLTPEEHARLPGRNANALPFTGLPLVPAVLLTLGLLQLGIVALTAGRRRAGPTPS